MAIDKQAQRGDTTDFPAKSLRAVTPHDTNELPFVPKALYVGTGGNIVVIAQEDSEAVTFANVPDGAIIPVRARIVTTASTAADIVALI